MPNGAAHCSQPRFCVVIASKDLSSFVVRASHGKLPLSSTEVYQGRLGHK